MQRCFSGMRTCLTSMLTTCGRGGTSFATQVCYICGRQFGSASLPIHQKQCMERWHLEQAKLPPEQRRSQKHLQIFPPNVFSSRIRTLPRGARLISFRQSPLGHLMSASHALASRLAPHMISQATATPASRRRGGACRSGVALA